MLTNLKIYSARTSAPELGLSDVGEIGDPIQIREITGLGPVNANVNTTPFSSFDGEAYSGSTVGKRNIVLMLQLNPDWVDHTVASLRQLIYTYFMPKQWVKLVFTSDDLPEVQIEGYVESMEPNIFSKDPQFQVSIICPLPDFVALEPVSVSGEVLETLDTTDVVYEGTVPTGFILEVRSTEDLESYSGALIVSTGSANDQLFQAEIDVNEDHYFKMSTVQGKKSAQQMAISGGSNENVLNSIASNSNWIQLEPGVNLFSVVAANGGQEWTLIYTPRFGGL